MSYKDYLTNPDNYETHTEKYKNTVPSILENHEAGSKYIDSSMISNYGSTSDLSRLEMYLRKYYRFKGDENIVDYAIKCLEGPWM